MQMSEELLAFIPVLLLLSRRLGYNAIVAVAISMGAATVAAAFSPIDPFMVGIAQKVSGLPLLSGSGFRLIFLAVAMVFWIVATMRYAARIKITPEVYGFDTSERIDARIGGVLVLVLVTFVMFVVGVMKFAWDFEQLAALFFIMGVLAGLIGKLGLNGTANAFVEGFQSMAFAGMLIGFARGIYLVLEQGRIVDTIVHSLFLPLEGLPPALSAIGMMISHIIIHLPVPSSSGHAVLTLPILIPLSDLIGLSRQVTVLAYQYGIGVIDLAIPTNGALMAMLAAMGVSFGDWLRFLAPRALGIALISVAAIVIAIAVGLR
jgi:uncharacterized ion transporter superfamily protein YfcC